MSRMSNTTLYRSTILPNGLTVLTAQNDAIPVVDAEVWTRTGYRYEKPEELGYAHLLEHMLFTGTERRPTQYDLALEIDGRGGYFNASTNQEAVVYEIQMMAEDAPLMCDVLSDMLFHSRLTEEALENEKKVVLQELKIRQDNHGQYLHRFTQKKIFPGHPLSHNILDTEATTIAATPERLRSYLAKHYRPDQSALVLAGAIDHERAVALAEQYFGHWKAPETPFDPALQPVTRAAESYYYEHRDIKQTFFTLNYYAVTNKDLSALAAFSLLRIYLAGGSISMLNRELREKRGLVYTIGAGLGASPDAGVFSISTSTEKPRETLDVIESIVSDLPNLLTAEAVEQVRRQAIGSFMRYIVKPGNQSSELGGDFIARRRLMEPHEWLTVLTNASREMVIDMAQTYLRSESSVLTVLGPEDLYEEKTRTEAGQN